MIDRLPLTDGGLDRSAHRRQDDAWLDKAWHQARVLPVAGGEILVAEEPSPEAPRIRLVLLSAGDLPPDTERYFLGVDGDGVPYFAAPSALPTLLATPGLAGGRIARLREVGEFLPPGEAATAATAVALDCWHRRAGYSPTSGRRTRLGEAGWTRTTEDGSETLWPVTAPAAITLVHDGVPGESGRCLLANNATWQATAPPRYSCLAGFVEPGESAEQAAAREVFEEVGVVVSDVRYVTSQPWPFPGSLMLAFTAVADPTAPLRLEPAEIAAAGWYSRTDVAAALAGRSTAFRVPPGVSVARHLLTRWLSGTLPVTTR